MKFIVLVLSVLFLAVPVAGVANAEESAAGLEARVRVALEGENRTEAERARDKNRKPVETLAFLQIEPDMDVLELVPGGGWYTKLLAAGVKDTGTLSTWVGVQRYAKRVKAAGIEGLQFIGEETPMVATDRRGIYDLPKADFGSEQYDAVLTFRNAHNLTASARAEIHRAVFAALRPGGIYGLVDHTRRHMEPDTGENRRRLDPVVALHELLAAGFEFEAWSDLHFRPDDELRYEVGRRSVTGNSDRFTFRMRKPH